MLTHIDQKGNIEWYCEHEEYGKVCKKGHKHHISHAEIKRTGPHMVALPPCTGCGAQTFLKVHFEAHEMTAHNKVDAKGETTKSHAAALRHMDLHQQLQKAGKGYR